MSDRLQETMCCDDYKECSYSKCYCICPRCKKCGKCKEASSGGALLPLIAANMLGEGYYPFSLLY